MAFYALCAECEFEISAETVDEVLDRQADHRRECGSRHVLEFGTKQTQ